MKTHQDKQYIVNFNTSFKVGPQRSNEPETLEESISEEAYQAFCHQTGMSVGQRHIMSSFASKMHMGLKDKEAVDARDIQSMIHSLEHFYIGSHSKRALHQ